MGKKRCCFPDACFALLFQVRIPWRETGHDERPDIVCFEKAFRRTWYLFIYLYCNYLSFLPDVVKRGGHLRPLEQAALGHGQHLFREIPRRVISSLLARNLAFSSPTFAPTPTTALCCALFIWASISLCIYLCIYTFTHTSTYLDLSGLVLRLPSCPSVQTTRWTREVGKRSTHLDWASARPS